MEESSIWHQKLNKSIFFNIKNSRGAWAVIFLLFEALIEVLKCSFECLPSRFTKLFSKTEQSFRLVFLTSLPARSFVSPQTIRYAEIAIN